MSRRLAASLTVQFAALLPGFLLMTAIPIAAQQAGPPANGAPPANAARVEDSGRPAHVCEPAQLDSPYIPVDSWVYPAVMRLYSLGFLDNVYLNMRPWTRFSVEHMLEQTGAHIEEAKAGPALDEAQTIYESLLHELHTDMRGPCLAFKGKIHVESVYSVARAISGTPLDDSYHLGSTIINDYGRPFQSGFNNYSGESGYASAGRFLVYVRGEFQGAPSATGYSTTLADKLTKLDGDADYFLTKNPIPLDRQATIPVGPISTTTQGRFMEAYVSAQVLNHEISFGKQDDWLGPGLGGGMAYSNNAENIYSFRINRTEPLRVPFVSRYSGPFRYEFIVGPLKGHTYPIDPWVHSENVSFRPTRNLEFGYQRTVIWGGKDHEPINIRSFLRSFFSVSSPNESIKFSNKDPGARFSAFNFSYRIPFVRDWLTIYMDSEVHDDVSPFDAPHRAALRPGLYLSHVPGAPKLDIRAEAAYTDPPASSSDGGEFMYFEAVQRQGYTNNGQIFGDWMGREAKGGQGWITYHLSGNEWIQVGVRNQKAAHDFIQGGTTLNDLNFQAVKRLGRDFEVNGKFAYEHWKAPIYLPGQQTVTTTTIQFTWFPERKVSF